MTQDPFIKLTTLTNVTTHVLYNSIIVLHEGQGSTSVTLFGGTLLHVKESVTEIKKAIDKASQLKFRYD